MSCPQRSMKHRNLPPLKINTSEIANSQPTSSGLQHVNSNSYAKKSRKISTTNYSDANGSRSRRSTHPPKGPLEISDEMVSAYLRSHPAYLDRFVIEEVSLSRIESWSAKRGGQSSSFVNANADAKCVVQVQDQNLLNKALVPLLVVSKSINQKNNCREVDLAPRAENTDLTSESGSKLLLGSRVAVERPNTSARRVLLQRSKMLEELTRDIYSQPSKERILCELKDTIAIAVNADGANLYLVDENQENVFYYNTNVKNDKDSSPLIKRIGPGSTLAAHVAYTRESKRVDDIYEDDSIPEGLPSSTPMVQSVLAQPILQENGRVAGVVELYRTVGKQPFAIEDEEIMSSYIVWGGLAVSCSEMYHKNIQQQKLNEFILNVTQSMFGKFKSMEYVIKDIMNFAQSLVQADRASLFLVDSSSCELYARLFDMGSDGLKDSVTNERRKLPPPSSHDWDKHREIRFPIDRGIAGHVATTGETLNITDAYSDTRFNREIDHQTGYTTKTILCMPVKLQEEIIGVVQMLNKVGGHFTSEDESQFRTFATYCGLALHIAKMYEKIRRSEQKYKVALEVLSYHSRCTDSEIEKVRCITLPNHIEKIDRFDFSPWQFDEDIKCTHVLYMFRDLFGLQSVYSSAAKSLEDKQDEEVLRFDHDTLLRFTLTVRKNYRQVPYHNWSHAFSVAHSMYTIIKSTKHNFTTDESLALFIACLCHDLDHRGKTNQFMVKSASPLAAIYSTSTMEHHHFNMTVSILQRDGHNIFKHLSSEQYKRVLGNIKHCILATDLAKFFEYKGKLQGVIQTSGFQWSHQEHRLLCMACTMTASDLCSMYKPWKVQLKLVMVIMEEFWLQGDEEKRQKETPIPMMDRDLKYDLPDNQVGFIQGICLPCYSLLQQVLPESEPMMHGAQSNLLNWKKLADLPRGEKEKELAAMEKLNVS